MTEPTRRQPVGLSFDLEDWHQLVHRRFGADDWDKPHPAFEGQMRAVLDLLDKLDRKATFFVLGMSAKNYPKIIAEVAAQGHELASHGYGHAPLWSQTPAEFRRDLKRSVDIIEGISGRCPIGYRAPAFSMTPNTTWAYEILVEMGFLYDSSQYDSPKIRDRLRDIPREPYRLVVSADQNIWELPVASRRLGFISLPIGGGGYWRFTPSRLLILALRHLAATSRGPVLYFHPYECDPNPLHAYLPDQVQYSKRFKAACRSHYRNMGRDRVPKLINRVSREFEFVTYEKLLQTAARSGATCSKSFSPQGSFI